MPKASLCTRFVHVTRRLTLVSFYTRNLKEMPFSHLDSKKLSGKISILHCLNTCFQFCIFHLKHIYFLFTTRRYRQFFTSSKASASDLSPTCAVLREFGVVRL